MDWAKVPQELKGRLTDRQQEVVEVRSRMREVDAAEFLGLKPRLVRKHMEAAKTKIMNMRYGEHLAADEFVQPSQSNEKPSIEPDPEVVKKNAQHINKKLKKRVSSYVITWAQNVTPVHQGFLSSLKNYCNHTGAVLTVIPGRYRNPTSVFSNTQEESEYWAPEVAPYLMNHRIKLNDNVIVMGDIKIQPTASQPLTGLNTITGGLSGIFGHPKLELVSVATPQNVLSKILTTTGAITVEDYTDSKAGKKGEFHHSLGACLVEIEGDEFHIRQLSATEEGSFIDLEYEYTPEGVKLAGRPLALVMGDVHTDVMCDMCERVTFFDDNGIVPTLEPEAIVLHDWYDGYSGSHHHKGKVFINYAKHHSGRNNVGEEIKRTFQRTRRWLESCNSDFYILGSNHNEHLGIWLEKGEPKNDPENALFYHSLMAAMLEKVTMGATMAEVPDPLKILVDKEQGLERLVFLDRSDSLMIGDIDCSHHGDKGANGSRGALRQFDAVGVKTISGHSHSPGIFGGAYRVGTNSPLHLEYNTGLSSWLNTDCLISANGKRTLITKINGKWRANRRVNNKLLISL